MSILAKERHPEEQGKIYGLIDATDAIGFLLSTIVIMLYRAIDIDIFLFNLSIFYFIFYIMGFLWQI